MTPWNQREAGLDRRVSVDPGEPPAAEAPQQEAGGRGRRAGVVRPWLVVCCYLAAAIAVTARLWVDPAGRAQAGDSNDVDLFLADGAAAAVLAFALDRAWAVSRARDRGGRPDWPDWPGWAGWWPRAAFTAVAVLAVLPLVPRPYHTAPVQQPPVGWDATLTNYLSALSQGLHPPSPPGAEVRAAMAFWRPSAVVAVTGPQSPVARADPAVRQAGLSHRRGAQLAAAPLSSVT